MSVRRGNWHPLPAPTPRILHFPHRSRLSRPAKPRTKSRAAARPNIELLLRQDSRQVRSAEQGRAKVQAVPSPPAKLSPSESSDDSSEEGWRFQVEVLRAECGFLRMERELALRKMDKNRAEMESVLRFALETLVSGKKRIGGKSASKEMMTFDKEIRELQAKLEEIRSDSRPRSRIHSRSAGNFNQRALLLRRRLKKMEETCVREIHEVAEYSDVVSASKEKENLPVFADVEMLRRKMEGLSRGMREMMEEHKLLFLPSNPAAVSCGGRHQTIGCAAVGVGKSQRVRLRQAAETFHAEEEMFSNSFDGCCNCKNFVVKIIEQVGFETEQWGEMQAMLDKVKADMDELCSSRDHWENRALSLELSMRSFYTQMVEWKRRAHDSEQAATELRDRIARISAAESSPPPTLSDQLQAEISRLRQLNLGERTQASPEYHGEMAKETVIPRYMNSKKSCVVEFPPRRASLREIGNLSHSDSAARLFR